MKITFLGTGTSQGVPTIGCCCSTCLSLNPKNSRLRTSARVHTDSGSFLIDCSKDFRQQALSYGIEDVTDLLITHTHADHVFGIDELRAYNKLHEEPLTLHVEEYSRSELATLFPYLFGGLFQKGGGVTSLQTHIIEPGVPFCVAGVEITPIRVMHGKLPILGYRFGTAAYITDCSYIPDESFKLLEGVETLVVGALRYRSHTTHFSLEEAVVAAEKIGAKQSYFVHIAHDLEHDLVCRELPDNMTLAYDGLVVEL